MGIFNLFSKATAVPRTDLVWATAAAKLAGTRDDLAKNRPALCVAWFSETHKAFNRFLNEENHMNIDIKMADSLRMLDLNNTYTVFLEHYPVYSREAALLSDHKPSSVCFMNSLDDTFFQLFGGNIAGLMRSMGLGENEYIESAMISNTIIKAQKKVEKKIQQDLPARSGEEWMARYRAYDQQRLR